MTEEGPDTGLPSPGTIGEPPRSASHSGPLSILVVDDHHVVGYGVRLIFEAVGIPATVTVISSVVDLASLPRPDVVVLDLRLHDGSTPTQSINTLHQVGLPVVVYTSGDDPMLVREAIAAGALAIIRKSAPEQELVSAVLAATKGEPSASLDWAAALDTDCDWVADNLTNLETQILSHYACGQSAAEVAKELFYSVHTINKVVARIRDKYRIAGRPADSRVDLFRRAAEDGIVSYFDGP